MLTLLCARAGQEMQQELLERMGRSKAPARLLLVPEQYSHEVERALCRVLGSAGTRPCQVLSFTRLCARVADTAGGGAAPMLDAGGRMLLLYRALRQAEGLLSGYRACARKPAFLGQLMATIDECRSYGVTPETLTEVGETMDGPQGERLRDIGLVYGLYEAMTLQSRADPSTRLDRLAADLERTGWAAGKEVWIWGFTDFTHQELEVVRALLPQAPVTVALTLDEGDESEIFDPARRTARALERLARDSGAEVRRERLLRPARREESLIFLEENLFASGETAWEGHCAVVRAAADDPRQEVQWAAGEILRLVQEEGLRFRDIALCARSIAPYEDLIDSAFSRCAIPFFLSSPADVLQKPVVSLVTAALGAVSSGYPYEEMFRYLKTGLAGVETPERDALENYVLTWDIKGGQWTRERPWDMHPDGYGRTFTDEECAQVDALDALRRRIIAPLEALRIAPDHTGKGWALAVYRLLEDIGLPGRLAARADALEQRGDRQAAEEYRQLWSIVVGALEQCAGYLGDTELEAGEFARLMELALGQYTVGTIPAALDRVTAADAPRLAGREVKVLFLLGADSQSIPGDAQSPGLFSDLDRETLAGRQMSLAPTQAEKLQREMTIVYETCALPRQRLYVSYSAAGSAGEERVPSFLYQRLGLLFPDGEACRARDDCGLFAPQPALERAPHSAAVAGALAQLPEYAPRAARVLEAGTRRRGSLSPDAVRALYGGSIPMSATRMDLFHACHFSYFMKYGLGAKPRQQAKFSPADYGTFIHAVLEEVLREGSALPGGAAELARDGALRTRLTAQAANRYEQETLSGLEGESARVRYTFARMKDTAQLITESAADELAAGSFAPTYFELGFGRNEALPPIEVERGMRLRLTGFVDRVDSWVQDGKRYLRVVDYKTGKKAMEYSDLADGRGLQMLLYLFTLQREGQRLFGPEELVSAGVLYMPARSGVVSGERDMTDEQVRAARQSLLRRRGLLLDDEQVLRAMEDTGGGSYRYLPIAASGALRREYLASREQLERLEKYLERVLGETAEEFVRGDIDADPYWHTPEKNACRYCDYAAACHFEEGCGDVRRRRRAITAAEFWEQLEKGGDGHGH